MYVKGHLETLSKEQLIVELEKIDEFKDHLIITLQNIRRSIEVGETYTEGLQGIHSY